MREFIARIVCFGTVAVVVVLAAVFALRHNVWPAPGGSAVKTPIAGSSPNSVTQIERGRQVFLEASCGSCHSVGRVGNPRRPLDGVEQRRRPQELEDWITASGTAANQLADSVVRRKQQYRELSVDDMAALVAYLRSSPVPRLGSP